MNTKTLEAKLEIKRNLLEKYRRRAARIPGNPRKGNTPGGNTRKRRAISKANQYAKQAHDLEVEIEKLNTV